MFLVSDPNGVIIELVDWVETPTGTADATSSDAGTSTSTSTNTIH